ncbi:MAG: hypothetical protein ACKOJ9_03260 [Actinomycetota bacterium]
MRLFFEEFLEIPEEFVLRFLAVESDVSHHPTPFEVLPFGQGRPHRGPQISPLFVLLGELALAFGSLEVGFGSHNR